MNIKSFVASFLALASLLSPLSALPVHALSPVYPPMSSLIKTPASSALYWYASNGKRYVFPSLNTFYSWFSSDWFANVRTLGNAEMAAIPFGGNITYRPGAKMVKIQTDPRVYVVARNGVLRWVTSESIAQQLYGASWAGQVQDIPDAFFVNYQLGAPIYNTSDYHVATEYHGVRTPDDDVPPVIPPYAPPYVPPRAPFTGNLQVSLGTNNLNAGQSTNLYAQISNPNTTVQNLRISLFDQSGSVLKTCYQGFNCDIAVYAQSGVPSRTFYAQAFNEHNEMIESSRVTLYTNQTSYSVPGTSLTLGFNRSEVRVGESLGINATVYPQSTNPPYYRITIYDQWGSALKVCESMRVCTHDFILSQTADTQRSYYARAVGSDGQTLDANYAIIQIRSNTRSFSGYSLGVTSSLSSGIPGQSVSIAASIAPSPYDVSDTFLEIWNQATGEMIRRCYNANYCQVTTNLPSTVSSYRYYAVLTDTQGTTHLTGYSPYLSVGSSFSATPSISTNRSTYYSAEPIYVTSYLNGYNTTVNNLQIDIYSERSGFLQTCVGTASCSVTHSIYTQGASVSDRFSIRVRDFSLNQELPAVYTPSIVIYP